MNNTVNDLRYETKFENCVKVKNNLLLSETMLSFFKQKHTLFLETYFFKIPKNLIASAFFIAEADTKKHRYPSAKASNAALVKLIKSLKMIM